MITHGNGKAAWAVGAIIVLATSTTATHAAEGAATAARFDITEFRVLGNSTLSPVVVERAVYGSMGPGKSIEDVQAARDSLESAYRSAGYATVFVDIPEQQVDSGVVRLRVTEGKLDRIRVTGARYFSNGRILAEMPSLEHGTVPKLSDVQTELTELNRRSRDMAIVPVLKAGRTPGAVDVELKVADDLPLHASLEVNDRYTADTTRTRVTVGVSFDNLFQNQHSLSLQYQTAPEDPEESRAIVASYTFRLARVPDTVFALYAVDSNSDIAAFGTLGVLGNGRIYGARLIRSLSETPTQTHSLAFGLDYKDFLEDIRLESAEGLQTPITYLNWSMDYNATLRSDDGVHMTLFNAGINFGIRGRVNSPLEFADKRYLAKPNYFYVRGGAQHRWNLPGGFQAFGRLDGQLTQSPLVSNEQMQLGGVESVRGYLESTYLGDYGINGSVELRQGWPLSLLGVPLDRAHMYAFVDGGRVNVLDPLEDQTSHFSLASVGIGMRLLDWHGLDVSFDLAHALLESTTVAEGADRLHFGIRYVY